jgi:hypothetical protein
MEWSMIEAFLNWRSVLIGTLIGVVIVLSTLLYMQGEDYRQISRKPALSTKELVGVLPNGKTMERYIVPYHGRFHYVYVVDDVTTINKRTINGKTSNIEAEVFYKKSK